MDEKLRDAIRKRNAALGARIREARKRAGLTQGELGKAIGVTQASVTRWETGRNHPPLSLLLLVSGVTRVAFEDLVAEYGADWLGEVADADQSGIVSGAKRDGVDIAVPTSGVTSYDPDEKALAPGLQALVEQGVLMTAEELKYLEGYVDHGVTTHGASGADRWTSEEWLHVLMDDRKIKLLGRLPKGELTGPTRWIDLDEV
ncbi:MAG TPA: helix-turn-helix transcriptional regulator [Armatimonadota bacterium]|nr:helix-turn-helix transcriptional regulator [Armatimonadota bacterium]